MSSGPVIAWRPSRHNLHLMFGAGNSRSVLSRTGMRNKVILRSTDVHLLAAESRGGWLLGRVLVTGIAGFIGSHLGQALVRAGFGVRGVDAFTDTYAVEQKRDNAALLTSIRSLELITADLAQIGSGDLYDLLADVEAVVHLAGQPGVPDSWGAPFQLYVERNVTATQRLLDASAARRVDRFVYASSSSVYGPSTGPVIESSQLRPSSPYGATKLAGECLVGAYAQERGLSTVALRYFSVYGPRQRPDMAAHRFIEALLDDQPLVVHGDGRQVRDFTYVDDVVAATTAALTADLPPGTVLNVARGEPVEVREVVAILAAQLAVEPRIDHRPHRPGDTLRTQGCADAARRLLGWEAGTDVRTGLRRQVDWHVRRRLDRPAPARCDPRAATRSAPAPAVRTIPHAPRLDVLPAGSRACSSTARTVWAWATSDAPPSSRRSSCGPRPERAPSPCPTRRSGGSSPRGSGHDYCKLPSVRKNGPGDWSPVSLASSFPDVLAVRSAMLRSTVESFQPDVMLVDHMPHGAMGELVPRWRRCGTCRPASSSACATSSTPPPSSANAGAWRARMTRSSGITTACWSTARPTSSTSPPSTTGRRQPSSSSSTAATCAHPLRARGCGASGSGSCVERPARGWW